jgi:hypothetical protein
LRPARRGGDALTLTREQEVNANVKKTEKPC